MAIRHVVTKGFPSVPFLVTQGWGDYDGSIPQVTAETTRPTGGWPGHDIAARHEAARLRRLREEEREELAITLEDQRKIDRAAAKILRSLPEGLNVSRETLTERVSAAPAFDALLAALQPTEGQVVALVEAILERIAWMTVAQRADEEAALMALLGEI